MWQLDDQTQYLLIHSFDFPKALTWGEDAIFKREYIRSQALKNFPVNIPIVKGWGFRIYVWKTVAQKNFDVENVPKLIVDAFSKEQIRKDKEKKLQLQYTDLGLFENDTIDYVRIVEVAGERAPADKTLVEIFGCKI